MPHHDLLVGRWIGEGAGEFPTIEPFRYRETLVVEQVPGKPLARWHSTTVDLASGQSRHAESGFVRSHEGGCELVLAHGFGIAEIALAGPPEAGRYRFTSSSIAASPTAKEVAQVVRALEVDGDELRYEIAMAAVGVPLTHHLRAALRHQEPPAP